MPTVKELRTILMARGHKGLWKLKKDELEELYQKSSPTLKPDLGEEKKVSTLQSLATELSHEQKARPRGVQYIYESLLADTYPTIDRYVKLKQLGKKGKEGTTFLVIDSETEKPYAMKCFRKAKSPNTLVREAYFQVRAHRAGVAPKVVACDRDKKCIVMDVLSQSLLDILKINDGHFPEEDQEMLINLYNRLDKEGIVHNDANPLNIMKHENKLYLIDYGFAKEANHSDFRAYRSPNVEIMPLGLLLWMKKLDRPTKSWKIIRQNIPENVYKHMKIDEWP
jgi:tRNA A-37 threonylcarbamoyl transferase component Bud32